jgi:hypothetical protein
MSLAWGSWINFTPLPSRGTIGSLETLVNIYQTTWCHIPAEYLYPSPSGYYPCSMWAHFWAWSLSYMRMFCYFEMPVITGNLAPLLVIYYDVLNQNVFFMIQW